MPRNRSAPATATTSAAGPISALWRRLDCPGHDAAQLQPHGAGWLLRGMAVFEHAGAPAALGYQLVLAADGSTRSAQVRGFAGPREISHTVERDGRGWRYNGRRWPGLDHLQDVDLGFTPATNRQHLLRADLAVGGEAALAVLWLDVDAQGPQELPQHYARHSARTYRYRAPSVGYEAILELADNGFAAHYPRLWTMVRTG